MQLNRVPTPQEIRLLEFLINKSSKRITPHWQDKLLVRTMDDGEMGSLYLFPDGEIIENRLFGLQVSEHQFLDEDGVDVIASLNIDKSGNLFELDIWKTDYSSLIRIPEILME